MLKSFAFFRISFNYISIYFMKEEEGKKKKLFESNKTINSHLFPFSVFFCSFCLYSRFILKFTWNWLFNILRLYECFIYNILYDKYIKKLYATKIEKVSCSWRFCRFLCFFFFPRFFSCCSSSGETFIDIHKDAVFVPLLLTSVAIKSSNWTNWK